MKKLLLSGLAIFSAYLASAQDILNNKPVIDLAEDTTQVVTIKDIISVQEQISSSNSNMAHYSDVWSRNSYFNIGYNIGASLDPKQSIPLNGYTGLGPVPRFNNKFGAMVQLGHSYCLHKNPIANMVQINLDFTFVDLNFNQYDEDARNKDFKEEDETNKGNRNLPWLSRKYEFGYAMTLGPSVTVAPLTSMKYPDYLHYIKINAYYHLGCQASLLALSDINNSISGEYINWGIGFVNSFGINLSWKSIGIGWESRIATPKYKSISSSYGTESYKFKATSSRIYLTLKY